MKNKILILLFVFFTLNLFSEDISGNISGNLSLENSPYHLVGDIVIPSNSNLNIEAGVQIIADGYFQINVNGSITAIGEEENPIIFSGLDGLYWGGIRLDTDGSDETNEFVYCIISNTNDINDNGIHAINSKAIIDHCEFFDHQEAINLSGLSTPNPVEMSVTNSVIYDCTQSGIFIVDQSNALIDNNEIYNCGTGENYYGAIQLSIQCDENSCNPTITNNWIHNNGKQGLTSVNFYAFNGIAPLVENNLIEENLTGVYIYGAQGFYHNNIIRNNFIENDANSGAGVMLYGATATAEFTYNEVYGNYCGFYLAANAIVNLGNLENYTNQDDGYNQIYDNVFFDGTPFNINNVSSTYIYAQNNVWDNDDQTEIEERLISDGIINYQPFLSILAPVGSLEVISNNPLNFSWEIAYNTHASLLGYQIYKDGNLIADLVSENSFCFDELPEYPFTLGIVAQYEEGNSELFEYDFIAPIANPPQNLDYSISDLMVTATWDAPEAGSDSELDHYLVYFQETPTETTTTTASFGPLEPGQEYTIGVSAVYQNGCESDVIEVGFIFDPSSADEELILKKIALTNFPNPFNSNGTKNTSTTFAFNLPADSFEKAKIVIFNTKGQIIKKLDLNEKSAKQQKIYWNGLDKNNLPLASGNYLYKLEVDEEIVDYNSCTILK